MELRQLKYFVAVAEELNFTRAAQRVGIAQPPLSQQILALERELEAPLFTRTKRRVELTQCGETFLTHARRTLRCAEEGRLAAKAMGKGVEGTISVGAIYTAAYSIVPPVLRSFRSQFPLVKINLREMTIHEQHKALRDGVIDVGFLRPPLLDPQLEYVPLLDEKLVAIIPSAHRLRRRAQVTLKEIAAEPFVSLPPLLRDSVGAVVAEMFGQHGLELKVIQEVGEMHTLICLVASGLGVSVVPASLTDVRLRDVVYKPIAARTPSMSMCLATSRSPNSLVVPHFVQSVRAAFPRRRS